MNKIKIGKSIISEKNKTYFIADIASNHDGNLNKAKDLIFLAKESGANAAKFQNFSAETLVCEKAFRELGSLAHQAEWKSGVFESYDKVKVPLEWTLELKRFCDKIKIDYFTSPYALEYIDYLDPHVVAWKVGSGDITWHDSIEKMAKKRKPIILATGASSLSDVKLAVKSLKKFNNDIVLMQCNTNYTGSIENFKYINLNVLKLYKKIFKNVILGLSDHTPGHSTVLGAIALGARVIEKHFTNNNRGEGPDHKFSLNPKDWKEMVLRSREIEQALGYEKKKIEKNEIETVVIQRRGIRVNKNIKKGLLIKKKDLSFLRPCTKRCLPPYQYKKVIGKKLKRNLYKDDVVMLRDLK